MRSTQTLSRLLATLTCIAGAASASYGIVDTYDTTNFFEEFTFFSGADPTQGMVNYLSKAAANISSLAGFHDNAVYLGVDSTTMSPSAGRSSIRVTSKKSYTKGLFVTDIAHMPGAECGVWPAFWTTKTTGWPASGEIDIIEGVNAQKTNAMTLHTSEGCTLASSDCGVNGGSTGCPSASYKNSASYGAGFNAIGGGVYAMEWTSTSIKTWFFPRGSIPADITSGAPVPTDSSWGAPAATFVGSCNIDNHFDNHNIIFDTDFCGDWAGASEVWNSNTACKALASTCNAYVKANPTAFTTAYWLINSVKVYQEGAVVATGDKAVEAASSSATYVAPATVASSTYIALTVVSSIYVAPTIMASSTYIAPTATTTTLVTSARPSRTALAAAVFSPAHAHGGHAGKHNGNPRKARGVHGRYSSRKL